MFTCKIFRTLVCQMYIKTSLTLSLSLSLSLKQKIRKRRKNHQHSTMKERRRLLSHISIIIFYYHSKYKNCQIYQYMLCFIGQPVAISSTMNTSTLCSCNTQIIVIEKNSNLSFLCGLSKRKITIFFFKTLVFFFQNTSIFPSVSFKPVFYSSVSHYGSLSIHETTRTKLYIKASAA